MIQYQPEDVVEAVRSLCPVLDQIPHGNPALAEELRDLLRRADQGEPVHTAIIALINQEPRLRRWLRQALVGDDFGSFEGSFDIPSVIGPPDVDSLIYRCPLCQYAWALRRIGQPIPKCPADGSLLEPSR